METKEKRVYKIVLTGGPCGGKTTGQARLSTFFENLGWKVFRVPETATVLLSGGIKFSDLSADEGLEDHACPRCMGAVTVDCHADDSEAYKFQENLLKTMIQIENTFFELADTCPRDCLIICDRGAMDASAYDSAVLKQLSKRPRNLNSFPIISKEKWEKLMAANNWNNVELRDNRYNQIVHMVTAANGAEDFYSIEDHACRSEGVELARDLDYNAAAAWVGHPYFDVIDNSTEFEKKIRRMIASICQKMGIDTGDRLLTNARKRKFLVQGPMPTDSEFPAFQDFDVVHNYLTNVNPLMQARLRKRGQKGHWSYTHTLRKPKMHGQVVEVKTQLTHRDYINLLSQKDDSHFTIYKLRRCFLDNNQYFQLDVYKDPCHPRCNGLMLLETYSALEDGRLEACLPNFLNINSEVTDDPSFSMYNLSLREEWANSTKFTQAVKEFNKRKTNGIVKETKIHVKYPPNGKIIVNGD